MAGYSGSVGWVERSETHRGFEEIAMRVFQWGKSLAIRLRRSRALARLRKFRGLIPADFKFDREEANRRG
jgi:hypothetical protein